MDLQKYFNERAANGGTCYRQQLAKVRRVEAGDKIFVNNFGLPVHTKANEQGYHVELGDIHAFVNEDDFAVLAKEFREVTADELGIEKADLPEDADFKAVKKGERIVVQPFSDTDLFVESEASQDGYTLNLEGKKRFFSDIEFRSMFNVQAAPQDTSQKLYLSECGTEDSPVPYIILDEEVTLPFKEGDYTASAGEILIENPKDIDGYTVVPADYFAENYTVVKAALKL